MRINPTDSKWDTPKRRPKHSANFDPAVFSMLVLEVGTLGDLAGWPPVGQLVESLTGAVAGDGGMTRKEVDRLRYWARRWRELRRPLRRFFKEALRVLAYDLEHGSDRKLEQRAIDKGLWHIFEGFELPPWAYGLTLRLYDELEGGVPDFELLPRGRRSPTAMPRNRSI